MARDPRDAATPTSSAFAALGVAPGEERLYLALLRRGGATVADLAKRLRLPVRATQRLVAALEAKGLVTRSHEGETRYGALPPDIAADVLIAQRHSELHQARLAMTRLRDTLDRERPEPAHERIVEILSRQAAGQMFLHSIDSARTEIIGLERMPMLVSTLHTMDPRFLAALERGVRCRSVTDSELLRIPGTLDRLRKATAVGEHYRIYPALPFKLVVFDRRFAIIPLHLSQQDGPVLLVRSSSLLDALCEMFEMYWRAAAPFETADANGPELLIPLLAAGMNDKSIEHELGISARTLARRIALLAAGLGATTRFQAGWLAGRLAR